MFCHFCWGAPASLCRPSFLAEQRRTDVQCWLANVLCLQEETDGSAFSDTRTISHPFSYCRARGEPACCCRTKVGSDAHNDAIGQLWLRDSSKIPRRDPPAQASVPLMSYHALLSSSRGNQRCCSWHWMQCAGAKHQIRCRSPESGIAIMFWSKLSGVHLYDSCGSSRTKRQMRTSLLAEEMSAASWSHHKETMITRFAKRCSRYIFSVDAPFLTSVGKFSQWTSPSAAATMRWGNH